MREKLKIAAISTTPHDGNEEYRNAEQALAYVDEAVKTGAQLICFPEGYPGPCFGQMDSGGHLTSTPVEMLCERAAKHSVFISCGNLEPSLEIPEAYFLTHKLISPEGKIIANYRRCQPTVPVLNASLYGGKLHLVPGNELCVIETAIGKIGLLICSELWVPELSRIEMLMGAELIIAPIGGIHKQITRTTIPTPAPGDLSTERCIARARAAENLLYVVTTINVFPTGLRRGSFIAGPEGTIAASNEAGILYGEIDLPHLWFLRSKYLEESDLNPRPGEESPYRPSGVKYGIIHERRPELYRKLVEPQPDAYDYFYFHRGLDAWKEEYRKVHRFHR